MADVKIPLCVECAQELFKKEVHIRMEAITSLFGHTKLNMTLAQIKMTLEAIVEACNDRKDDW